MAKQGSTSDAEMLAEAAMLREHRNRLENRMVNDHFVFIIVNIIIIIVITILTGGCAHILTKSGHGDPNHNYCDIHNIHNIHNIHYILGIQNIVQVILEEHNRQLESQLHKLKGILEV